MELLKRLTLIIAILLWAGSVQAAVVFTENFSAVTGDNPTGWDIIGSEDADKVEVVGGACRIVTAGDDMGIKKNTIITSGNKYKFTFTVTAFSGFKLSVRSYSTATTYAQITSTGTKSFYFTAGDAGIALKREFGGATDITFDNISIEDAAPALYLLHAKRWDC